ncbi:MAG: hypothetical protein R3C19_14610 [Planctomycetaceae bacterium]
MEEHAQAIGERSGLEAAQDSFPAASRTTCWTQDVLPRTPAGSAYTGSTSKTTDHRMQRGEMPTYELCLAEIQSFQYGPADGLNVLRTGKLIQEDLP